MPYRLGQRVCRVVWQGHDPGIEVQRVTRKSPRIIEVNEERTTEEEWSETHKQAIYREMRRLFQRQAIVKPAAPIRGTIALLNKLVRLERKFVRHMRKKA